MEIGVTTIWAIRTRSCLLEKESRTFKEEGRKVCYLCLSNATIMKTSLGLLILSSLFVLSAATLAGGRSGR